MNSQWILGEGCVEKLGKLWQRYRNLCLDRSNERWNLNQKNYNPWMPLAERWQGVVPLIELLHPKKLDSLTVVKKNSDLEILSQAFREVPGQAQQSRWAWEELSADVLFNVDTAFSGIESLVEESQIFLKKSVPWIGESLENAVQFLVPIYHEKDEKPHRRGFSHIDCLGSIFTSFVERKCQSSIARAVLAVDLAHELGHHNLMLLQHSDPILLSDLQAPVYSSIRQIDRPAIMSFHAAVATSYMLEMVCGIILNDDSSVAEKNYAQTSLQQFLKYQTDGLQALRSAVNFSQLGCALIDEIESQLKNIKNIFPFSDIAGEIGYFPVKNRV